MIEPRAELRGGDTEVGTKKVFAEEALELHADRMLQIRDAAHVAGCVPGIGALIGVLLEFAKVRRAEAARGIARQRSRPGWR